MLEKEDAFIYLKNTFPVCLQENTHHRITLFAFLLIQMLSKGRKYPNIGDREEIYTDTLE